MINGNVKIQWLDINNKTSNTTRVKELFKTYSDYMKPGEDPYEYEMTFGKDRNIQIRDLFGWSRVLCIKKRYIGDDPEKWNLLETFDNDKIILSKDSIIPLYDVKLDTSIGFHGEIKYGYKIRSIHMIQDDERIRILNKISSQLGGGTRVEFDKAIALGIKSDSHRIDEYGYEIYTKSGFYNASHIGDCRFHLFASENKKNGNKIRYK